MVGNTLIQQRRGKGKSPLYVIPGHLSAGKVEFRSLDARETDSVVKGKVVEILKDSAHYSPLMRIKYETGEEVLLPAVEGIYVGKDVYAGAAAPVEIGNVLPLKFIPEGTRVCMIELRPGDRGKLVRSSGTYGIVLQKTEKFVIVKLPSGQTKKIHPLSRAMIGVVAGGGRQEKPFVKAGNRYYWTRAHHKIWPIVSAVAKNAADHPFGGKHKRNKGKVVPLPKHGYPIKYGYYGSRKTGRGKGGATVGTKKKS
ncbi:MAG TPA: 50S ribosomal protein L2 [Candidatus Nanopusillus sp.]|nr:50S ribosomal protein L2 [Candidatus Nanopusillus sp.]HIP90358.1 50S ribosomal protein L2 [Candidatus Nanopusillus sp.]